MKQLRLIFLFTLIYLTSVHAAGPAGIESGLRLWLDASDTQTMFTDTGCTGGNEVSTHGDTVNCWQDKSGNGNDAVAAIGAPQWVDDGGLDAIEFTSDRMDIDGSSGGAVFPNGSTVIETEVFFVARTRTISNGWGFGYQYGGDRYGTHFPWGNGNVYFDVGTCCGESRISAAWGGSSSFLHTWNFINDDGATNYQAIYRDGTLVASDGVADRIVWGDSDFQIGAYGTMYQQINAAEVIIYDRRLTPTEREQVKNYLLNKWREPIEPADDWTQGTTKTVTAPSGTDRLLVVTVGYEENNTANDITSVTYGGQALTEAVQHGTGNDFEAAASIWYLDDDGITAATNTTITVNTSNGNPDHTDVFSAVYTGIDQNNPLYDTTLADDGQSGLPDIESTMDITENGLSVATGQCGNTGTWGSNLTTVVNESGNSTSHFVATEIETEDEDDRTISANHSNNLRMAMVAAHFRSNVLPEVTGLSTLSSSDTSINLTWTKKNSVPNYRIAYQTGTSAPGNCQLGTTIDAGTVGTYQVTGLTAGTQYSFRVCANSGTNYSNGTTGTATTDALPPDPPNEALGVNLTINGPDSVSFSWVAGGGGTIGHRLAYATGSTAPADCLSDTQVDMGGGTTYTLDGLTQLTQYSYRICAYNGTPLYSTGLTGTFTTPGIATTSSEAHVVDGWKTGASRTTFGSGQNRALVYVFGFENGSDIQSVDFGGQAMTKIDNLNNGGARTEIWALGEAGINAATTPKTAVITFTGGNPTYTVYSSVVLANIDQSPFFSDTNTAGANATTDNLSLNTENGGISIVGSTSRRNNAIGSIDTAGWQAGILDSNAQMALVTTHKESNAAGTDDVDISFSGAAIQISMVGGHFKLADPTEPVGLALVSKSDVQINVDWTSGLGSTTGFRVAYQAGGSAPADCSAGADAGDVESYSITGLTAETEYGIRVCPYNIQGTLGTGITIQIETNDLPVAAPNEILSLNLNPVSDTQIALNWLNGGGSTESFQVAYQAGGSAPANCTSGTTVNVGPSTAYQVNGLTQGTQYSFRVCSVNADTVYSTGLTTTGTTQTASGGAGVTLAGSWQTGLTRTMDAGSNRVLIVAISSEDTVDADVTAVTYGGKSLTHAKTAQKSFNAANFNRVELWYLLEADIATASGTTIAVTFDQGVQNARYYSHAVFANVDQASPIFDTGQGSFANTINPISADVDGELDGVSIAAATTSNNGTFSANNSWVFGNNQDGNTSTLGTSHFFSTTTQTETGSFSHTGAGRSAVAAIHLSPAEASPNELSGLSGNALNSSVVQLNWTSGGGTTSGFRLAYQTGGTAPTDCLSGTQANMGPVTTKQVTGLTASTQYSFRVCAYNDSLEYTSGQTVTVTTSPPATTWTGANGQDWDDPLNWDNGVPDSTKDCTVPDLANDPIIDGATMGDQACKNMTINAPIELDGNPTAVELAGYGIISFGGTAAISGTGGTVAIRDSSTATQTFSSTITIPSLKIGKSSGGSFSLTSDFTTNDLQIEGGANFTLNINSGITLNVNNDLTIPASATIDIKQGGELRVSSGSTIAVTGGTLKASGAIDTSLSVNPSPTASQAFIGTVGDSGTITFNATSGTIDFTGVYIDRLDNDGLQITGTTSVSTFNGVHLTNKTISSGGQDVYINSTGTFPASAIYYAMDEPSAPGNLFGSTSNYKNFRAPGNCGSGNHTLSVTDWHGNFRSQEQPQILDTAPLCDIVMSISSSPISLAEVQITPFSDAIVLEWKTSAEILHKGFNVYRSDSVNSGYVKINEELVLNSIFSVGYAGEYRFIDNGVEDGKTYYYLLEDVAISGDLVQHGPYSASLDPLLGPVPTFNDDLNQYEGNIDFEDVQVSTNNPWIINIIPGANIYQLPNGNLRLHIVPPAYTSSDSSWNASYKDISLPSYVLLSDEDKPALPFTELLIPMDSTASNITATVESEDTRTDAVLPVPAPGYTLVGGTLTPNWQADAATYSSPTLYPGNDHVQVEPVTVTIEGKHYLKIKIYPLLFKGSDSTLQVLEESYIDISYDEAAAPVATGSDNISFSALEKNGARISYTKAGHYKVSFEDLYQNGLESAFTDIPHSQLELRYKEKSLPLHIVKANQELFGPGDTLVFYAPFEKSQYTLTDSVYLTINENSEGLRYVPVTNDYQGYLTDVSFPKSVSYEQDNPNLFVTSRSLGAGVDHYFWKMLYLESGDSSYPAASAHCVDVNLDGLNGSEMTIELSAAARSNLSIIEDMAVEVYFSSDSGNKVELLFNGQLFATKSAEYSFEFSPAATEELCIAIKPFTAQSGEYNLLDLNSFKITYNATPTQSTKQFSNLEFATQYSVPYDSSKGEFFLLQDEAEGDSYIYKNFQIDGSLVSFTTQGIVSEQSKFEIVYLEDLLTPSQYRWTTIDASILDTIAENDLLIITSAEMMDEVQRLADHKADMGLSVSVVDHNQIYDLYSHGRHTPEAFRDLFKAITDYSSSSLKYVLFALDATTDPRDYQGNSPAERTASYMDSSDFHDYASENWMLKDGSNRIELAFGRLPVNSESELYHVIEKIIKYETEQVSTIPNKISFNYVNDSDVDFESETESYSLKADSFDKSLNNLSNSPAGTLHTELGNSFIVNFMGHGNEYGIGSSTPVSVEYLNTTSITSLSNSENLPIMMTLNCLSNYFSSADPTDKGLGEALLLQESTGAIGVISANTLLSPADQAVFANYFYDELERTVDSGDSTIRLGDIIKNTRSRIHSASLSNNQIDSIFLLGDPSLKLPTQTIKTPAPVVNAPNPVQAAAGGGCSAVGSENGQHSKSWPEGLLEMFFLFGLGFAVRRLQKRLTR